MSDREWQIGICGTFDVENYGDLLFPLIAEAELRQRLGSVKLHRFSYKHKTLDDWPYSVSSLAELPAAAGKLDGMIVGGGGLIRFDKEVAPGYGPPPGIHHPTGYWLTPMLIALQYGCPVVWNAPGVYLKIPAWAEPLLELVINLSSYVAVRDEASQQALSRFAKNAEIKVVPDTAFGVGQLVNLERPSPEYLRLRESVGLRAPYIVVQATAGLEAFSQFVRNHPQIFQDYQFVILPIGPILGDDTALFDGQLPAGICLTTWPAPLLIAELIGQAAAVVGVSLHLAITSIVFGVPVLRPAGAFGDKFSTLLGFNAVVPFESETNIDPQRFAARPGRAQHSAAMLETTSRLSSHWDNIAAVIAGDRSPAALETLAHFWQSMPGWLETSAVRCAAALAERDAVIAERDAWAARSASGTR
jgi:lipopolysaccharide transport system ATP-binding protein